MANKIVGSASGNIVEVDVNNNGRFNLPGNSSVGVVERGGANAAGFATMQTENDGGSLSLVRQVKSPTTSDNTSEKRLNVGMDTPLFNYTFNATVQDTGIWKYVTATMTNTWGTTGMLLNANSTATTTTGTCYSSWRQFNLIGNGGLNHSHTFNITVQPLANQVLEFGMFPFTAGTAAPTEGVYLRFTTAGLIGVINYNGTETTTSAMATAASFNVNQNYVITVKITERDVRFFRDGVLMLNGILTIPVGNSQPFITTTLPLSYQFRNSGTVSGTQMQVKITDVWVDQKDISLNKPYSHIQAAQGLSAYQGTSGNTQGTTALLTNSLGAGAGAVMTNTTAALGSGLGGQFSALPTLAAGTDGIVSSFQVPAGSINITPRTLYITGARVQGCVSTVLVGNATAVAYQYSLAYGHNAVSLATAEAVAAKAPRRIGLGFESYAAAAAVGTVGQGVSMTFVSPIVVNPGEFIQLVAKNLGVVTTTGVITFTVAFDGYWE